MVRQAKNWCFTLNNFTQEEYDRIHNASELYTYLIIGRERGERGTPHLQGHIVYKTKVSARAVKSHLGNRAHFEISKSPKDSINYCRKEGDYLEYGTEPRGRGGRSDLLAVQKAIRDGASIGEIRDQYFGTWVRYHRAIERYYMEVQPRRQWSTEVIVFWGETGSGKSRAVHECAESERTDLYTHTGTDWFDGYNGQQFVLFDDFGGHEFKLTYLLKLLDRYPMLVPVKGGFVNWVPRKIYITSNKPVNEWYVNATSEHRAALKRRITEEKHFIQTSENNGN